MKSGLQRKRLLLSISRLRPPSIPASHPLSPVSGALASQAAASALLPGQGRESDGYKKGKQKKTKKRRKKKSKKTQKGTDAVLGGPESWEPVGVLSLSRQSSTEGEGWGQSEDSGQDAGDGAGSAEDPAMPSSLSLPAGQSSSPPHPARLPRPDLPHGGGKAAVGPADGAAPARPRRLLNFRTIGPGELTYLEPVGQGAYARVYLARWQRSMVVVKLLHRYPPVGTVPLFGF